MTTALRRDDGTYWLAEIEERLSGAVYEIWGPFAQRPVIDADTLRKELRSGDNPALAGVSHTHEQDGDLHEITDGANWERYDAATAQWVPAALYVGYEHEEVAP